METVGSTSWHHRHLPAFRTLDGLLRADGIARPTIIIVGPGAVTLPAAPFLSDASRPAGFLRQLVADVARYADQLARRIPAMPLRSLEPVELRAALTMPFDLTVVDRSARVLEAVARDLPDARRLQIDIAAQPIRLPAGDASSGCRSGNDVSGVDVSGIEMSACEENGEPAPADVIIAFNVICRCDDPARAARHVIAALRPGGYLLVDDRTTAACLMDMPLEHVAPKIHCLKRN